MNENFYENILDHAGEAVFILDRSGNIVYVNDYLLQHSIMTKAEILSSNSNKLFRYGQTDINIYQMVLEQKRAVTALQTITTASTNSKNQMCMVTQTPIIDEDGEVEWIVGVIRDLDILHQTERYIHRAEDHVYHPDFPIAPSPPGHAERPIYKSKCMERLFTTADAVAASDATILILGESGVGKEVMASYIHCASPRGNKKMVAINCAALNESLLESELFGYEKGAFTGATATGKKGLVELSNGSTLFLDEVDSLPLSIQAKFLRVLETHEVRPLGGNRDIKVDFRVIAATNADLEERVANHQFREDLFYRLNVLPLIVPPLRERPEDIPFLVEHFLSGFELKYGRRKVFSQRVMDKFMACSWPGNVRELRNLVERLVLITDTSVLEIRDIPDILFSQQSSTVPIHIKTADYNTHQSFYKGTRLKDQVDQLELELIDQAIKEYGSYSKAAKALGISKSTLIRKRNRWQI